MFKYNKGTTQDKVKVLHLSANDISGLQIVHNKTMTNCPSMMLIAKYGQAGKA